MNNQQATAFEIGWLLGIIEGEGSIGLYWNQTRQQIYPILDIVNTEKEILEYALRITNKLGTNGHIVSSRPKGRAHWKTRYDLNILGIKRLSKLLAVILPYWQTGTAKSKRAKLVLEFCQSRLGHPVPENGRYTQHEHDLLVAFNLLRDRGDTQYRGRPKRQSSETICSPVLTG